MNFLDKSPQSINGQDIEELINEKVIENKRIEYKKELPGEGDKDKVEFGRDVSSFANASGGYIIYGVNSNEKGEPIDFAPLNVNLDKEILRLESIIRSRIEPRVPGITTFPIKVDGGSLVVIHIPKSWISPHVTRITSERFEFYSRTSNGKYPLDYSEIKASFLASERTIDKIKDFRANRIGNIIADEMPIDLEKNPKIVLHTAPISAFTQNQILDLSPLPKNTVYLEPIGGGILDLRYNFDGYFAYYRDEDKALNDSYTQVFTNGSIESVNAYFIKKEHTNLRIDRIEKELVKTLERYIEIYKLLKIEPPFVLMMSLINVKGFKIHDMGPIERDLLIIPEIIVESFDIDVPKTFKPIFDKIWNAAGWAYSTNYENDLWKLK